MILFPEVQLTEFFPQFEKQDVRKYRLQIDSLKVSMLSHINGIITEYSYAGIDVEFKGNEETGYSLKIKNEKDYWFRNIDWENICLEE